MVVQQFFDVLRSKLQPSIAIQQRGSTNIPLRNSTLFGPQINTINFGKAPKQQVSHIDKQLGNMNK